MIKDQNEEEERHMKNRETYEQRRRTNKEDKGYEENMNKAQLDDGDRTSTRARNKRARRIRARRTNGLATEIIKKAQNNYKTQRNMQNKTR